MAVLAAAFARRTRAGLPATPISGFNRPHCEVESASLRLAKQQNTKTIESVAPVPGLPLIDANENCCPGMPDGRGAYSQLWWVRSREVRDKFHSVSIKPLIIIANVTYESSCPFVD
jgi:hypothetical protein